MTTTTVASVPVRAPVSAGERLLAAYLDDRRWRWAFEREVGGRRPDFTVTVPGLTPVCFEVFEPEIRLPRPGEGPWFDSLPALRGAFNSNKQDQIKAVRSVGWPCVVVLAGTNSDVPIDPLLVASAMFGRLQVSVPLSDGSAPIDAAAARTMFKWGDRQVHAGRRTGLSGLAIVSTFNPTQWRLDAAMRQHGLDAPAGREPSRREVIRWVLAREHLMGDLADRGLFRPDAREVRLVWCHNPNAEYPLPYQLAGGPHDEHWGLWDDGTTGWYGPVAHGRARAELPTDLTSSGA